MKNIIKFLILTFFISCEYNNNDDVVSQLEQIDSSKVDSAKVVKEEIVSIIRDEIFKPLNSKAILLGEKMVLLDENENVIKDISSLNESVVKVIAKSTKLNNYKNIKDAGCNEFYWVKVIVDKDTGYINGNNLFEPYKNSQNKKLKFGSNEITISVTKTMGQREFDENEECLMCYSDKPILLKDKEGSYEGVVTTIKNEFSDKNNHYFSLFEDDGAGDEILKTEQKENKIILTIRRIYQEGGANMKVAIYKNESEKYVAEIFEYKSLEEDELQKQLKQ